MDRVNRKKFLEIRPYKKLLDLEIVNQITSKKAEKSSLYFQKHYCNQPNLWLSNKSYSGNYIAAISCLRINHYNLAVSHIKMKIIPMAAGVDVTLKLETLLILFGIVLYRYE